MAPYLQNFEEQGGTIVIIFGEQPSLETLAFLGLPELLHVADLSNLSLSEIAQPDLSNPFFENIFETEEERLEMPMAFNTVNWPSTGGGILNYKSGAPFVSRSRNENIFYIGAPLKDKYTNFHRQALFVPVMYRLAALSQSISDQLYYYINDARITIKKGDISAEDIMKLQRSDQEIIPSQFISGNKVVLELPKYTLQPGFYDLEKNKKTEKVVAFNYNKEESRLEQVTSKTLNNIFNGNAALYEETSLDSFKTALKERTQGKALWKYCLALALAFLLAEILLIRLVKS